MKIIPRYALKCDAYTDPAKLTPEGVMLHSVGCSQSSAEVFCRLFNEPNLGKSVHGFIDGNNGNFYQTLPFDYRAGHAGGSANNTHIGVEMCEPDCITYTRGSSFTCSDLAEARKVIETTYTAAVELFALLCKKHNLDPLKSGVIISHKEGGEKGLASGHVDPEHLWRGLDMPYTMDGFRKAVSAAMGGEVKPEPTPTPGTNEIYRVQVGAFRKREFAEAMRAKLAAAGYDAFIVRVGDLYKVQVGAFKVRANAVNLVAELKAKGYDAFIVTATTTGTATAAIKVGDTVRVKQGARTYDGGGLADFVYNRDHVVAELKGDRAVITYGGVIVAAVNVADLTKV